MWTILKVVITNGDADVDHSQTLKLLGGYSQIIGGHIPPSPPCFGTHCPSDPKNEHDKAKPSSSKRVYVITAQM